MNRRDFTRYAADLGAALRASLTVREFDRLLNRLPEDAFDQRGPLLVLALALHSDRPAPIFEDVPTGRVVERALAAAVEHVAPREERETFDHFAALIRSTGAPEPLRRRACREAARRALDLRRREEEPTLKAAYHAASRALEWVGAGSVNPAMLVRAFELVLAVLAAREGYREAGEWLAEKVWRVTTTSMTVRELRAAVEAVQIEKDPLDYGPLLTHRQAVEKCRPQARPRREAIRADRDEAAEVER